MISLVRPSAKESLVPSWLVSISGRTAIGMGAFWWNRRQPAIPSPSRTQQASAAVSQRRRARRSWIPRPHQRIPANVVIGAPPEDLNTDDGFLQLLPATGKFLLDDELKKRAQAFVASKSRAGQDPPQLLADNLAAVNLHAGRRPIAFWILHPSPSAFNVIGL